ncbi:hypothetical protein GpartN1_g2085.t1 [Galdieria partita]|uniref:FLZ-type domain-containing protein n=1 Tax=Galdieria partita TaxID=83374 RepID=A0A9C7PU75_9RHOD|nr:hypothetical protein GpartN1_g2085.t1 [Galdieria partita]
MCHTQVDNGMQVPEPKRPFGYSADCNTSSSFFEDVYSASFKSKLYNMVEEIEQERAKYCNSANLSCVDVFNVEKESYQEDCEDEEDGDSLRSWDIADESEISQHTSGVLLCDNCGKSLIVLNDVFKWNDMLFCNLDCYTSALLKSQKGIELQQGVTCSLSPTWHKSQIQEGWELSETRKVHK